MKKLLLITILALTLNAEMTPTCKSLAEKIAQAAPVYNKLIEDKEYPLAHVILTRLVVNMAWTPKECNKNNLDDKEFMEGIYRYFNIYYDELQELEKKYGKIKYMYKR